MQNFTETHCSKQSHIVTTICPSELGVIKTPAPLVARGLLHCWLYKNLSGLSSQCSLSPNIGI